MFSIALSLFLNDFVYFLYISSWIFQDTNNMTIDLYYLPASTPCRAVLLTANAVGVQLNLKYLDLFKGEHMTPQFLKVCGLINIVNSNFIFC
jgi:hypothetical protein